MVMYLTKNTLNLFLSFLSFSSPNKKTINILIVIKIIKTTYCIISYQYLL